MSTVHDPEWCEIRIQGYLDERWSSWFDGMTVTPESGGVTLLHGPVADQAALHGLLARLRDLGVPLIAVAVTATRPPHAPPQTHGEATP